MGFTAVLGVDSKGKTKSVFVLLDFRITVTHNHWDYYIQILTD